MITSEIVNSIYEKLISDETFCRLVAYGIDPLSGSKADIVGSQNHMQIMDEIIKFSPQISTVEQLERTRMCLYKGFSKLSFGGNSPIIKESIQIDIYIPHSLVDKSCRVYQVENKIVALLDKMQLGLGHLDYTEGQFIQLPAISGYAQYKMIFHAVEGRPSYGKR